MEGLLLLGALAFVVLGRGGEQRSGDSADSADSAVSPNAPPSTETAAPSPAGGAHELESDADRRAADAAIGREPAIVGAHTSSASAPVASSSTRQVRREPDGPCPGGCEPHPLALTVCTCPGATDTDLALSREQVDALRRSGGSKDRLVVEFRG
ncbi:MAG: hypothetical protein SangKO_031920 [Sandaracinaceae bacterium]